MQGGRINARDPLHKVRMSAGHPPVTASMSARSDMMSASKITIDRDECREGG